MRYEFTIRPSDNPTKKWWSGWVVTRDEIVVEASRCLGYTRGKRVIYVLQEMQHKQAKVKVSE